MDEDFINKGRYKKEDTYTDASDSELSTVSTLEASKQVMSANDEEAFLCSPRKDGFPAEVVPTPYIGGGISTSADSNMRELPPTRFGGENREEERNVAGNQ